MKFFFRFVFQFGLYWVGKLQIKRLLDELIILEFFSENQQMSYAAAKNHFPIINFLLPLK